MQISYSTVMYNLYLLNLLNLRANLQTHEMNNI